MKDNWQFMVGNGTRVRFWTNFWCGPSTLCHSLHTPPPLVPFLRYLLISSSLWSRLGITWMGILIVSGLLMIGRYIWWRNFFISFKRKGFPLSRIELSRKGQRMQPSQCAMPITCWCRDLSQGSPLRTFGWPLSLLKFPFSRGKQLRVRS